MKFVVSIVVRSLKEVLKKNQSRTVKVEIITLTNTISRSAAEWHVGARVLKVEPFGEEAVGVEPLGIGTPVLGVAVCTPYRDDDPRPRRKNTP